MYFFTYLPINETYFLQNLGTKVKKLNTLVPWANSTLIILFSKNVEIFRN
jgi:hypothetical protein